MGPAGPAAPVAPAGPGGPAGPAGPAGPGGPWVPPPSPMATSNAAFTHAPRDGATVKRYVADAGAFGITATMSVGDHEAMPRRCPPRVTVPLLVPNPKPWMKRFAPSASAWRISGPSPWSDPLGSFSRHWSWSFPLSRLSLPPRASGTNASAAATRAVTPQCCLMRIHPGGGPRWTALQGPRHEETPRFSPLAIEARTTLRCRRRLRASVEQISAARGRALSHRVRRVERAPRGIDSAAVFHGSRRVRSHPRNERRDSGCVRRASISPGRCR
jgi:hypothetical protein